MKRLMYGAVIACCWLGVPVAESTAAEPLSETEVLRAQVAALTARLEQLESRLPASSGPVVLPPAGATPAPVASAPVPSGVACPASPGAFPVEEITGAKAYEEGEIGVWRKAKAPKPEACPTPACGTPCSRGSSLDHDPSEAIPQGGDLPGWVQERVKVKDLAWRKGEYTIVPYGIGWANSAFDTSRTTNGAFVLFVDSEDREGEPSFTINDRATRLGLDVTGPKILGADSFGRVEIDFHGFAQTENRAGVLLRHAYGEFRIDDEWRVLGGQTWDVISPLLPTTVNYAAGYAAGNLGFRRPQLRLEHYSKPTDNLKLTMQGSINRTIQTDFVTQTDVNGEDAGWPTLMARVAVARVNRGCDLKPIEFGFWGHVGQERVDFLGLNPADDAVFDSWSLGVDYEIPLTTWCGVRGELFMGEVLATFLGGVNQGIDPLLRKGIDSQGGWIETYVYWTDTVHSHFGYGVDNPDNDDLAAPGRRTKNQFYFGNVFWDVTSLFQVGLELSWWQTDYLAPLAKGENLRTETVMKYRF